MVSSWLCSSAILLALAGCGAESAPRPGIVLRESSEIPGDPPALRVRLQLEPSPAMLSALEHGIPLTFELSLAPARGGGRPLVRRFRLQRSPLFARYLLGEEGSDSRRGFAHRNALFAALERQEFPLPAGHQGALALRARLVREALPPPLQLPALLDPQWRLAARFDLRREAVAER